MNFIELREERCVVPSELVAVPTPAAENPDRHDAKNAGRRARARRASSAGRMPVARYVGHVAKCLNDAARGGDIASAVVAQRMVLELEGVPCLPQ